MDKKMDKKNVLCATSRPQPSSTNASNAAGMSSPSIACAWGAINIMDDGDVFCVGNVLLGLAKEHNAAAIIGVWTAPMQELLARTAQASVKMGEWSGVECYAAWNVTRPADGGKPVFEHRRFCSVGHLARSRTEVACTGAILSTPLPAGMASCAPARDFQLARGFFSFLKCAEYMESDTVFDTYALGRISRLCSTI